MQKEYNFPSVKVQYFQAYKNVKCNIALYIIYRFANSEVEVEKAKDITNL